VRAGRGLELVPGQEPTADLSGARGQDGGIGLRPGLVGGHVATETGAGPAHGWPVEIVVGAVDGADRELARPWSDGRRVDRRLVGRAGGVVLAGGGGEGVCE